MCAKFVFQLNGKMAIKSATESTETMVDLQEVLVVDAGMCVVNVVPRYKCPVCHTEVWRTSWTQGKHRKMPKKCARCCRLEREARQLRKLKKNDEIE